MGDLLLVRIVIVLDLQLVHVVLRQIGLSEFLEIALVGKVEILVHVGALDTELELL